MVHRIGVILTASLAMLLALDRPAAAACGDGDRTAEEDCDDGNTVGGDGCAANCTHERQLTCALQPASTTAIHTARSTTLSPLAGQIVLSVGRSRAGEDTVPFVVRAAESFIAPAFVGVVGISCTTLVESPQWGAGNAGGGVIDCGAMPLDGIDVSVTADAAQPAATPVAARSGSGPMGSAILALNLSTHGLSEGTPPCVADPGSGPPAFGADAIPCTADDPIGVGRIFQGSTGTATARVVSTTGGVIERSAAGVPLDCSQIDGAAPFSGATLVAALPLLSVPLLGDSAVTVALACGDAGPVPTPTPRFIRTCIPTPTHTETPVPVDTATRAPTRTPTTAPATPPAAACTGDCNGDRAVTIDELVRAVNIALGSLALAECAAVDANADGNVAIDELVRAVNATLQGC